jgi:hypothetical protein
MIRSKILYLVLISAVAVSLNSNVYSGSLDLEKLCKSVYDIYASEEVAAKKEVLVYKKLNEMIGQTYSVKIIATDSVGYDRKTDMSHLKSTEIYKSDAQTGYFGVFVLANQKGDILLMTSTPGKEMSFTGRVTDILVTQYMKNNTNQKAYTSLKDFDDKGTIITQIILVIEI